MADICEFWLARRPFRDDATAPVAAIDVLELEDHAELLAVTACVFLCFVNRDAGCLADGQQVVF